MISFKKIKSRYVVIVLFGALAFVSLFVAGGAYFLWVDGGVGRSSQRWYSSVQVSAGEKVFNENCLSCHGIAGRGVVHWRQRQSDGSFPPPPLNGTAHTWHHPLSALEQTIKNGGAQFGGKMPAFKDVLGGDEIENVLAYIQSQWPEEIYQVWEEKINRRE